MHLPDKLLFTYDNWRGKEYNVTISFLDNPFVTNETLRKLNKNL